MAEFVSLPIYGSNGLATGRFLKINTRFFLGSAGVVANRFMEVVDESPAEIDTLDRIVSGLAPRYKESNEWAYVENGQLHSVTLEEKGYFGTIELVDESLEVEKVGIDQIDWWRTIPGYSNYQMNQKKRVGTAEDGKSVSIMRGRIDNVLLRDDDGVLKRISIDYLFQRTFPELA